MILPKMVVVAVVLAVAAIGCGDDREADDPASARAECSDVVIYCGRAPVTDCTGTGGIYMAMEWPRGSGTIENVCNYCFGSGVQPPTPEAASASRDCSPTSAPCTSASPGSSCPTN